MLSIPTYELRKLQTKIINFNSAGYLNEITSENRIALPIDRNKSRKATPEQQRIPCVIQWLNRNNRGSHHRHSIKTSHTLVEYKKLLRLLSRMRRSLIDVNRLYTSTLRRW